MEERRFSSLPCFAEAPSEAEGGSRTGRVSPSPNHPMSFRTGRKLSVSLNDHVLRSSVEDFADFPSVAEHRDIASGSELDEPGSRLVDENRPLHSLRNWPTRSMSAMAILQQLARDGKMFARLAHTSE
jgi:hypothetical protein